MKISYNWLLNYIPDLPSPQKTADLLTGCGLEVESTEKYESVKGGLEGCVIGEVLTKEKHPDADRLSLTTVDVGSGTPLHIVCGAANVASGQKVVVALAGTTLYPAKGEPITLKKTKIRGALSEGMICAEDELGLGDSHEGILVLEPSSRVGMPAREYFKVESDHIFLIGLTPNRPDAASHIGVARDLAALLKRKVKWPDAGNINASTTGNAVSVRVEDPIACPRYSGLTITGIKNLSSPAWLKNRLLSIGLRSINSVVDITNFVLHETGQPLHAFDAGKISGRSVVVKKLPAGTRFRTLDGTERTLSAGDLMICDAEKGMCIAGVFGGEHSGVNESTTSVFLESAYFDPKHIRRTSKHHGLKTDASFRFERGADPDITVYALHRAAGLILEICGGKTDGGIVDIYPKAIKPAKVAFTWEGCRKLAGKDLGKERIKEILSLLGIRILEEKPDSLLLEVPPYRTDVKRECDIVEELLRIYGYNEVEIPERMVSSLSWTEGPDKEKVFNNISSQLSAAGFREIFTNSLTRSAYNSGDEQVKILNPFSNELDVMRSTLLYGGLEAVAWNRNRKNSDLKFYEFGKVYSVGKNGGGFIEEERLALFICGMDHPESWYSKSRSSDIFQLKAQLQRIFSLTGLNAAFVPEDHDVLQPGLSLKIMCEGQCLGFAGRVSGNELKKTDLQEAVWFAELSADTLLKLYGKKKELKVSEVPKFPFVRRDLAMILDRGVTYSQLEQLAWETEKKLLCEVNLFDVYEGEKTGKGKKSYAMSFILRDPSSTLTDSQVEKVMERLMKAYREKLGAEIRQ